MGLLDTVATIFAFIGTESAKAVVGETTKSAYRKVANFLKDRYPGLASSHLEASVLADELQTSGAAADPEFAVLSRELLQTVLKESKTSSVPIGVDFQDVEAAALEIDTVISAGHGIVLRKFKSAGAIKIGSVTAGFSAKEADSKKG